MTTHPLVAASLDRLGRAPALTEARTAFTRIGDGLAAPMRVALVGRVSAGKSTLANALLGGYRAPTGVNELTFNVNWITRGTEPSVTVHFTDGRPPERRDVAELERLTVRAEGDDPETQRWKQYLASIAYLKITDPAPYLRSFDLVDTPGLDSVFAVDSANTLRFLDGPVDAIVLVFSRALHTEESTLLRRLQGSTLAAGPINTIAALTRVEGYWEWPDVPDPHAVAHRVVDQAAGVSAVAEVIYQLVPVASLVGAAAAVLSEEHLHDLQALATVDVDTLGWSLDDADGFAAASLPAPAQRRRALHRMLHGYGVMLACDVLREGVTDLATLRAELDRRSGMAMFRQLLVDHFGARADLLKLNRAYSRVQALPDENHGLQPRDQVALTDAMREFIRHGQAANPRFRELQVLRAHYEGRLRDLSDSDIDDLLRITGERGASPAARLNLPPGTPVEELRAQARVGLRRWAELDVIGGFDGPTRFAVAVARRAYERLLGELDDVRREGPW
ncbi:dynamin family protein [uncultured Pseudonocardia sp.]|uniref:dynamin family protein n=1 Tax=uncultured Pseudonocardia sp. TaxID=211455 RepID=UPI002617ECDB|nr:dynamin family protein [uncultured Pseudonocardia sp.]